MFPFYILFISSYNMEKDRIFKKYIQMFAYYLLSKEIMIYFYMKYGGINLCWII